MPDRGLWRSESAYMYVDDLDPTGIAWEFLRRNSDYREDFTMATVDGPLNGAAALAFARKWGLPFCDRSWSYRARRLCLLDPRGKPGNPLAHGGTKRDG